MSYILGIDQSTQGTKAILTDAEGKIAAKKELSHAQLINEQGWVSHDPEEIYRNVINAAQAVLRESGIDQAELAAIGISNQRETSVMWDRMTGRPLAHAVVWQCARAAQICEREAIKEQEAKIKAHTGLNLSPYFPAAKIAWLLEQVPQAKELARKHRICHATIDSWLLFKLTGGQTYKTDYSNASRTQLFDIFRLCWDPEICALFGIDPENLPQVCDSDAAYGETDLEGFLDTPVPIRCVMGDSHGALFGQNCLKPGECKATYGTGSSIMMNIGTQPIQSKTGVVTSIAWGRGGAVSYVLEGNLNYTGAVISWLQKDVQLIKCPQEAEQLAKEAVSHDSLYLVPAFSGLGAPYWNSHVRAAFVGMTRTTGRAELARAALECIAYQITDIVKAMQEDSGVEIRELRADGGPTANQYLMQFQSDLLNARIRVPETRELSAIGVSYCAGMQAGIYDSHIFEMLQTSGYEPGMAAKEREERYCGWKQAVKMVLSK